MRARGILAAMIVVAAAVGLLAGCSKKLRPIQNIPPETYVFIQGPVDTVNHRVHLYWYGTDADGNVASYEFRWVYPLPASQDPAWVEIKPDGGALRTDSMFTMVTGGGPGDSVVVVMPRFEIRAVDNEGARDPDPAVETFGLRNRPPVVRILNPLGTRDSTYASATVSWETTDLDGGGPGLHYRVWLDGNEASYDSTTDQTYTVPSSLFIQDGSYRSGIRTLYVQAVDDGGFRGAPAVMTWYVRSPGANPENNQGRLLVIDDVPSNGANNSALDSLYRNVASLLPAGTYDVLRPQFNPNIFRSGRDVAQTFRQFKAVLWYRGLEISVAPLIRTYQDSIGGYLDAGGNLYLDGLYLVQGLLTPGALREDFLSRHMGDTRFLNCYAQIGAGAFDSTAGWGTRAGYFRSSRYAEVFRSISTSAKMSDSTGGVRGFVVSDTSNVALWGMENTMAPPNRGFEVAVGVAFDQPGGGRLAMLTVPVRMAPVPQASNILRRILHEFGIGVPLP